MLIRSAEKRQPASVYALIAKKRPGIFKYTLISSTLNPLIIQVKEYRQHAEEKLFENELGQNITGLKQSFH